MHDPYSCCDCDNASSKLPLNEEATPRVDDIRRAFKWQGFILLLLLMTYSLMHASGKKLEGSIVVFAICPLLMTPRKASLSFGSFTNTKLASVQH